MASMPDRLAMPIITPKRLHAALVRERRLARAQHLPDRVPRHAEVAHDLLDRLALDEKLAPYARHYLHDQHLPRASAAKRRGVNRIRSEGSILGSDTKIQ
jgi:hypothetical protein